MPLTALEGGEVFVDEDEEGSEGSAIMSELSWRREGGMR